jgi:hypothetical protein
VTGALLYGYITCWVITSMLVVVVARRVQDEKSPPAHPGLMSIVAGAAWPILVVALAEAAFVALTAEAFREDQHLLTVDA